MKSTINKNESKNTLKLNLILVLASGLIACFILEFSARMLMPAPLPWLYPNFRYVEDMELTFALKPNQEAFTADKVVTISELGLRSHIVSYERQIDTARLLFLGDSVTFGFGVDEENVFVSQVQTLLQRRGISVETINAGVSAYNTQQEVGYLAKSGFRFSPDLVIIGFHWNDLNSKSGVKVNDQGRLVSSNAPKESGFTTQMWDSKYGYSVRNTAKNVRFIYGAMLGVRALKSRISGPSAQQRLLDDILDGRESKQVTDGWNRVRDALTDLDNLSDQYGFQPLVVAFPIPLAMNRSHPKKEYISKLQEICDQLEIPLLDLEPDFRDAYTGHESLYIPYDADHPNVVGHTVAAKSIAQFLLDQAFIRSND